MRSFTDNSTRFCYNCGFENPNRYTHCGYCNQENPVKSSPVIESPQKASTPPVVRAPKSRTVYIILGLLLGWLGLHNIYAKRNSTGAVQLMLCMMFFWTLIVPLILAVWSIVEIFTVKVDGNGNPMR
jgi:TM2 domain-containing membrane protein YozV